MGKYFVPFEVCTPGDRVREALGEAERLIANLRWVSPPVLRLLHLLDQVAEALTDLDAAGVDVRAERARFEAIQRRLAGRKGRFLAEADAALQEERTAVQPDQAHWWWFLDEALAQERKQRLRWVLTRALVAVVLLAVAWLVYDRFLAPPREVRQAFRHSSEGEALVEEGDLRGPLAEFEAAAAPYPDDPDCVFSARGLRCGHRRSGASGRAGP